MFNKDKDRVCNMLQIFLTIIIPLIMMIITGYVTVNNTELLLITVIASIGICGFSSNIWKLFDLHYHKNKNSP